MSDWSVARLFGDGRVLKSKLTDLVRNGPAEFYSATSAGTCIVTGSWSVR